MKTFAAFLLLSLATAVTAPAAQTAPPEPVVFGALSGNTGCVIFAEGHKTTGRFYGIAVTTKTVGKLTVIEEHNYALPQKQYLETQENMDSLMQMAQKDRVKFVKIPEKYSPELLVKAQASCGVGAAQ